MVRQPVLRRFLVAVRRQFRDTASLDSLLAGIDGLHVVGIDSARAHIDATEEAAAQLRSRLGEAYLLEELTERNP